MLRRFGALAKLGAFASILWLFFAGFRELTFLDCDSPAFEGADRSIACLLDDAVSVAGVRFRLLPTAPRGLFFPEVPWPFLMASADWVARRALNFLTLTLGSPRANGLHEVSVLSQTQ